MKKKVFALMLTLCMVLTMMPGMAWAEDGPKPPMGLSVKYNGNYITGGVIEIEEGGGISLPILYNGNAPSDDIKLQWVPDEKGICNVGISPDGINLDVYLSGNAKAGDVGTAGLICVDNGKTYQINLTVNVLLTLKLQYNGTTVNANETISSQTDIVAEVMFNGEVIKNFDYRVEGNAVCFMERTSDDKLNIIPKGNGYTRFSVGFTDDKNKQHWSRFTWHSYGVADSESAKNVVLELNGKTKQPGERFVLKNGKFECGKAFLNGKLLNGNEYTLRFANEQASDCTVEVNTDGTFTLDVGENANTFYDLVFEKIAKTPEKSEAVAVFEIQVQNPKVYVLQFYFCAGSAGAYDLEF